MKGNIDQKSHPSAKGYIKYIKGYIKNNDKSDTCVKKKTLCSNRVSQDVNHTPEQDQRPQVIDQHKTAFIYVSGCFVLLFCFLVFFFYNSVIHNPTWEKHHKVLQQLC